MVLLKNDPVGRDPGAAARRRGPIDRGDRTARRPPRTSVTTAPRTCALPARSAPVDGIRGAFPGALVTLVTDDDPVAAAEAARRADVADRRRRVHRGRRGRVRRPGHDDRDPSCSPCSRPCRRGSTSSAPRPATASARSGRSCPMAWVATVPRCAFARSTKRSSPRRRPPTPAPSSPSSPRAPSSPKGGATRSPATSIMWYAGMEGGHALADVLSGRQNPSGRLPFSIPTSEEHLPFFDRDATSITYDRFHGQRLLDRLGVDAAYPARLRALVHDLSRSTRRCVVAAAERRPAAARRRAQHRRSRRSSCRAGLRATPQRQLRRRAAADRLRCRRRARPARPSTLTVDVSLGGARRMGSGHPAAHRPARPPMSRSRSARTPTTRPPSASSWPARDRPVAHDDGRHRRPPSPPLGRARPPRAPRAALPRHTGAGDSASPRPPSRCSWPTSSTEISSRSSTPPPVVGSVDRPPTSPPTGQSRRRARARRSTSTASPPRSSTSPARSGPDERLAGDNREPPSARVIDRLRTAAPRSSPTPSGGHPLHRWHAGPAGPRRPRCREPSSSPRTCTGSTPTSRRRRSGLELPTALTLHGRQRGEPRRARRAALRRRPRACRRSCTSPAGSASAPASSSTVTSPVAPTASPASSVTSSWIPGAGPVPVAPAAAWRPIAGADRRRPPDRSRDGARRRTAQRRPPRRPRSDRARRHLRRRWATASPRTSRDAAAATHARRPLVTLRRPPCQRSEPTPPRSARPPWPSTRVRRRPHHRPDPSAPPDPPDSGPGGPNS